MCELSGVIRSNIRRAGTWCIRQASGVPMRAWEEESGLGGGGESVAPRLHRLRT